MNMSKFETKQRYIVNLVCPTRTLGLELTCVKKSKQGPFIVVPVDVPAISSEIKEGDVLVGIGDWFFDVKTSLDKVLNVVRRNMGGDQPQIRLIFEREVKSPLHHGTQEDAFDEKLANVPEVNEPIVGSTETSTTSKASLEKQVIAVGDKKDTIPDTEAEKMENIPHDGAEKMENIPDAGAEKKENIPYVGAEKKETIPGPSSLNEAKPTVDSNETKEVGAPLQASEPKENGSNVSTMRQDDIISQLPPNG